ncbi:MFS transporter [Embleya hyalina]|uniref:MFS transporter n=1 Tax=Embleya hyalina TaxID=516124 RepID=A0A401Z027_9ACTN|nr:MFS transporter [Embleya hyalina]GCE00136.1 MFS transporter [Embleya hyalina]
MYVADSRGTAAPDAARSPRSGRRSVLAPSAVAPTVLALGTVSLVTDVSSEMVAAVLPLYLVAGLGLSPLGFGLLDGIYNGVSALVRLVGGHLADRGGRHKTVAALGYGMSAACKPLLLVVGSLPLIGMVLAADRTGKGLRTAPRDALISLSCEPADRGRAFGVHRAMDTAGALLGPLVAFAILRATVDGYDAVFLVAFCIAVLGLLVLLLFVPARPVPLPAQASRPSLRAAVALLRRTDVRRLAGCALLLGLATVSDSFVYLLLQRRLGVADRWFALLPLGTASAFLLLAIPLGRLADRIGRQRVFLGGHFALLVAYVSLLSGADAAWLPCVVLTLHGCFYAATDGVLMAAAAEVVPAELRGSGLALVQTGQALARFVCSIAFGAAWTAFGDRTALTSAAVALTVCATGALLLRPVAERSP